MKRQSKFAIDYLVEVLLNLRVYGTQRDEVIAEALCDIRNCTAHFRLIFVKSFKNLLHKPQYLIRSTETQDFIVNRLLP